MYKTTNHNERNYDICLLNISYKAVYEKITIIETYFGCAYDGTGNYTAACIKGKGGSV